MNSCNPAWNEKDVLADAQFQKAMTIAGEEFVDQLKYLYNSWLPARDVVERAIRERTKYHPSGKIIVLGDGEILLLYVQKIIQFLGSCPWKEHFFDIETEDNLQEAEMSYVVYPDDGGSWRIQAIPVDVHSQFTNRFASFYNRL